MIWKSSTERPANRLSDGSLRLQFRELFLLGGTLLRRGKAAPGSYVSISLIGISRLQRQFALRKTVANRSTCESFPGHRAKGGAAGSCKRFPAHPANRARHRPTPSGEHANLGVPARKARRGEPPTVIPRRTGRAARFPHPPTQTQRRSGGGVGAEPPQERANRIPAYSSGKSALPRTSTDAFRRKRQPPGSPARNARQGGITYGDSAPHWARGEIPPSANSDSAPIRRGRGGGAPTRKSAPPPKDKTKTPAQSTSSRAGKQTSPPARCA